MIRDDGPMAALAAFAPQIENMLFEAAAKRLGKSVDELTVMEKYGGFIEISDLLDAPKQGR